MAQESEHEVSAGPWFRGSYFVSGHDRTCAVCGNAIKRGQSAVANHDLRQCAHLGCGTLLPRKEPK